ncbi:MAG: rSAM/selenodomain-associated transferase 2 [Chlamydiales bacterium]
MPADPERGTAYGPRIGVVIPTLNEARTLPALLERLLAQPGASPGGRASLDLPDEIVVVDGNSHDGTCQLAREAGVRVMQGPRCRGSQLALGARELATDVLLFLHADAIPEPGALQVLRQTYGDPQVQWTAMAQSIDAPGRVYRMIESAANARARRGRVFGDSGLAVRRELYRAVGGFANLPVFEDVELSQRLRRKAAVRWVQGACLSVSARRWESEGWLSCTLRNWMLRIGFRLGVAPTQLAHWYAPHSDRSGPGGRPGRAQGA